MKTIAVTGGNGKLGTRVIEELLKHGYEVVSLDRQFSMRWDCKPIKVDLNDLGQVVSALEGVDAVLHLAAIPAPIGHVSSVVFTNNVVSSYNLLEAASLLGIRKVIISSSESSYGFAWAPRPFSPTYLPVDEDHPQLPQESYGLSKVVDEATAAMFHRRNGMEVIALRFSYIMDSEEYSILNTQDSSHYINNLWSYIDIRDAVSACLASLHSDEGKTGAVSLNITADDTLSEWETERLLNQYFPNVTDRRRRFQGREAIVSNERAKELLGWQPQHSWTTARG